jgi:DNA-binding CsgD family transcriptional regulator
MFVLSNRKVRALFSLTHLIHHAPPWKEAKEFLNALHQLVPYDRAVTFLKLDSAHWHLLSSPRTITNLSALGTLTDHNQYFWQFKRTYLEKMAGRKQFSLHFPASLAPILPNRQLQEYQADYWGKHGIRYCYGIYTKAQDGYLATYISRAPGGRDFTQEERMLLDHLCGHLAVAEREDERPCAVFFADARGQIVVPDPQVENDTALAQKIRGHLPFWIKEQMENPLSPLCREIRENPVLHRFVISQGGFGRHPLFRISWTTQEMPSRLSPSLLAHFSERYALSPREREVLILAACGLQRKEMANHLKLSVETVKEYLGSLYRKVGVDGHGPLIAQVLRTAVLRTAVLRTAPRFAQSPTSGGGLLKPRNGSDGAT